ncbi:sensor histidine kinase [Nocardioides sp. T2.26MG-1]|uniref:sensor histidine kinase n=1 Tax=Nocardioides sp. T2.26MG-1 TaxID=3041166 RepID=UPI002477B1FF|nr:histidine kinase [Nocardioides sp. T2.26MG-1]CAI9408053.1 hypothetical protein HIDPHFAB_01000 [Nocardioides sp. T2.26MG-1]
MTTTWARLIASNLVLDVVVIAVTLGTLIVSLTTGDPFEGTPLEVGAILVGCVVLGARRHVPAVVLAVSLAVFAITGVPTLAMLAAGTVAERYGNHLVTWLGTLAGLGVVLWFEPDVTGERAWLVWGAVIVLPAAVGLNLAARREALAAAVFRADRLEAVQPVLQDQARLDERTRIAREMHDVVAHQVSLIALHAGGLELSAEGTPYAETAALIRRTAREALEELRSVIGTLRSTPDQERAPQPSVDAIGDMVARWQAAGMDVTLADRVPPGHRARGPAGRTAYRVIEESLTNASKHAAGSAVVVTLTEARGDLEVTVHNGPATRTSSRAATGSGTGLIGLRERADLLGGSIEAHEDGAGGFVVRLVLPLPEPEE